jgi:YD repeat-containing protein
MIRSPLKAGSEGFLAFVVIALLTAGAGPNAAAASPSTTGSGSGVDPVAYDSAGQPTTITDPLNHAVTLGYALGDLVSASDALGNTASRFLDAGGRVVRSTDPVGNVTSFSFNALNDLTKITDAKAGETSFAYDGNGNLTSLTDARSKVSSYTYDNMDRLATRADPLSRSGSYAVEPRLGGSAGGAKPPAGLSAPRLRPTDEESWCPPMCI